MSDDESRYQELKRRCEARVARWEWGTSMLHTLLPHYAQTLGLTPGKWLAKAPARRHKKVQYGLDSVGRLVVERRYRELPTWTRCDERFCVYGAGSAEAVAFEEWLEGRHRQQRREVLTLEGGLVARAERHTRRGVEVYRYEHEQGTVVRCSHIEPAGDSRYPTEESRTRRYAYQYDAAGALRTVLSLGPLDEDGRRSEAVRFKAPDRPLKPLLKRAERLLLELVDASLASLELQEPAYCLLLVHSGDPGCLPPELAVGLHAQRAAWVAAEGGDAAGRIWSAEDFHLFDSGSKVGPYAALRPRLRLVDPTLVALGKMIGHHLRAMGDVAPALDLLARVAKTLNRRKDWGGLLPTSEDFVAFPLVLGEAPDPEVLRACVPSRRRKMLKRWGLAG